MKRMSVLDSSWLMVESEDTPMHVGNLLIFSLPEGAPETFLRDMVDRMKNAGVVQAPWKYRLFSGSKLGRTLTPGWVVDDKLDLDYHVRHSACRVPAVSGSWACWSRGFIPIRWISLARCGNAISSRGWRTIALRCTPRCTIP